MTRQADSDESVRRWWIIAFVICCIGAFLVPIFACVGFSPDRWALILLRTPDFIILLLWLAAATGLGSAILKLGGFHRRFEGMLLVVTSTALGLGVMSFMVLGIGLCARMRMPIAFIILALGLLGGAWGRDVWLIGPSRDSNRGWCRWLVLPSLAALGLASVLALLPPWILWGDEPNGYDVLEYHLQVPREWYEMGRIVPLAHNVFSYFPFNVEMHYLLAMALRDGPWSGMYLAQLMHVAFIGLTVLAVYALISDRSRPLAFIAAAAVATVPWMGLLAPIAYDEGGLLLWGTLAIGLAIPNSDDWRMMCLAGAMAGFACGSKLTAVPEVLLAVPVVLVALSRIKPKAILGATTFVIAGCVIFSPWLIKNIAWVGNPVFPEETTIFGRAHWSETQVERWIRANHLPGLEQQNLAGRVKAGWDQVLADWRFGYALLPLGLISAVLAWKQREAKALLGMLLILVVFWLFFTHLQSRFFTLAIPIAALLIGQLGPRRWEAAACLIVVAITAFAGLTSVFGKMESMNSKTGFRLFDLIGNENLIAFTPLGATTIPPDADVVLVGDGRPFLYQLPSTKLFYRTVFDVDAKPGESSDDAWQAGVALDSSPRITVIDAPELKRMLTYWGIPQPSSDVMQMPDATVKQTAGSR